jgi:hypothetical protein
VTTGGAFSGKAKATNEQKNSMKNIFATYSSMNWNNSVSIRPCWRRRIGLLRAAIHATLTPAIGGEQFPAEWQRKERGDQFAVPCWRANGGMWDFRKTRRAARWSAIKLAWRQVRDSSF